MNTAGWYRRRRGVLEHIRDGRMSLLDNSFHDLLCQLADPGTGIALTSAAHLAREFGISRKLAQKYLCRLERKRYIRRIRKARSRSMQITLIHLFECSSLPHNGKVLNAWSADDYRQCAYVAVSRAVSREVSRAVSTGAPVPIETLETLRLRDKPAANPAASAALEGKSKGLDEGEQRRRIQQRDERLAREAEARREIGVGCGPSDSTQIRAPKPAEVSTAALAAAKNAPLETATPITRAREYATGEHEANEEVSSRAAAAAAPPMPIARARESTHPAPPGIHSAAGIQTKPGPQSAELTPQEAAQELRALKAKLAGMGR